MDIFRFLDLPREVRDLIYAETAKDISMELNRRTTNGQTWTFNIMEQETSAAMVGPSGRKAALPYTCRQLRTEVLEYMVANTVLYVEETHRMSQPTLVLKMCLPSVVRQRLRRIDVNTETGPVPIKYTPMPYADGKWQVLAAELLSACHQLQHVNIRDSKAFRYSSFDATNTHRHGTMLKKNMHRQLLWVKRVYSYYQRRGLALTLHLTYYLSDEKHGPPLTCWECKFFRAPEGAGDFFIQRRRLPGGPEIVPEQH